MNVCTDIEDCVIFYRSCDLLFLWCVYFQSSVLTGTEDPSTARTDPWLVAVEDVKSAADDIQHTGDAPGLEQSTLGAIPGDGAVETGAQYHPPSDLPTPVNKEEPPEVEAQPPEERIDQPISPYQ